MFQTLLAASLLASTVLSCADHSFYSHELSRRADNNTATEWDYAASYDWGRISSDYVLCQDGTTQAPIPLRTDQGLSLNHVPRFDRYNFNVSGTFGNWGYGPSMTFARNGSDYSSLPSFSFEENGRNETVYMIGWHIHVPADHTVQGQRSKAEMHFVHYNAQGSPRAVLAFRIDPGNADSAWFSGLPNLISYRNISTTAQATVNPQVALNEVTGFSEFWTYRGSLTSPPCTEGIRFFVARQILYTGVQQMRNLLRVSHYSARAEQQVWQHQINV